MAELVFRVKADYEQAIKLREELNRLESEMKKVDASTKDGQDQLAQLTKEYSETGKELKSLAEKAAEAGYVMSNEFGAKLADAKKQVIDLSVELVNAQKELDRLKNSGKATPQQIQDAEKKISDLSEALVKAEENYKDYTDSANKAGKGTKSLTEYSSAYNTIMRMLPGPIRSVVGGFRSLSGAALKFIATPLGAALLAISAAFKGVSYWLNNTTSGMLAKQKWTKTLADTTEKWADKLGIVTKRMKELSDATASGAAAQITAYRSLQRQWEQANGVLEKQKEVLKSDEWKKLGISISGVNDAEEVLVTKSKSVVEALMARARAAAMYQKIEKEIEEQIKREDTTKANNKRIEETKSEYQKTEREQERIAETFRQAQKDYIPSLGYSRDMKRGDDYYVTSSGEKVYRNNLSDQAWREAILRNNRALRLSHGKARQDVGFFGRLGDNGLLPAGESYDILANLYEKELDLTKGRIENLDNQIKENNETLDSYLQDIIDQMGEADSLKGVANDILSNVGANGDTTAQDESTRAIEKKRRRDAEDVELATTTARISTMKDGTEKTIAQINLNKRKEEIAIRRAYEDLREKKIEEEKKAFESNPDNKNLTFTYDYNSDKYAPTVAEVKKFLAEKNAIEANAAKATKDALFQEEEALYSYLKEYGNYWEKRLATLNHYNGLIERATTEGEKERLKKEKENALQSIDRDRIAFRGQSSDIRTQIDLLNSSTDDTLSKLNEENEKLKGALDAAIEKGESKEYIDSIKKDIQLNQENAAIVTSENALKVARLEKELADKYGTKADQVDALRKLLDAQSALIKDDKQRDIFKAGGKVQLALAQYGNWQDYDTYDKAVEAAQKVYEAKKAELELREDNLGLMNLETQHANDMFNIELKFNKDLATIFGNVSRYTKEQLENARNLASSILKAGKYTDSKGNTNALTQTNIKELQEAINQIDDAEFNKRFEWGSDSVIDLAKNMSYLGDLKNRLAEAIASGADDKNIKDIKDKIEQQQESIRKGFIATGVSAFVSSLRQGAEYMKQIAEAAGDTHMVEMAEQLGAFAQNLGAAAEGAATGGWIGAIVGGVSDIISQTVNAFVEAEVLSYQMARNAEMFANALQLKNLSVVAKDFESIFGQDKSALMSEYGKKATESARAYREEMTKLENTEHNYQQGVMRSLGGLIFTGLPFFGFQDTVASNENLAYMDAKKKGYNELQAMSIKTKDYSGWANFWGKQDEYTSLKDLAPQLWDENGELNIENAKEFLSINQQLSDEQRRQIEQVVEINEKYKEAEDGLKSMLSSMFGNTASTLADATIEGLHNGATQGAEDMKRILGGTAKELQKSMVESIYAKYMQKYQDKAFDLLMEGGGEEDLLGLYNEMLTSMGPTIQMAQNAARRMEEMGEAMGFDMSGLQNATPSQASYQTISETTGTAIDGRLTSLQISSGEQTGLLGIMNMSMSQMLEQVSNGARIADDVRNILTDSYLELVEIRKNTGDNVSELKLVKQMVATIEEHTRKL